MNNTMPKTKEAIKPALIDGSKLRKAQRLIKSDTSSWMWKLSMHMVKQAYGIECEEPLPEIGERNGNYVCTYVNVETGEYAFIRDRSLLNHSVKVCQHYAKHGMFAVGGGQIMTNPRSQATKVLLNEVIINVTPDFSGRLTVYVESGELKAYRPYSPEEFTCTLGSFIELAERAGWKVTPPEEE